MRQIVKKCWALVAVVAVLVLLGGCGPTEECQIDDDCGAGQACFDNACVSVSVGECTIDAQCGPFERCSAGECVARSCGTSADCPADAACDGGACVERQCDAESDCFTGLVCDDGICRTTPRQCTAPGQSCDPEEAVRRGFSCEDLGFGHQCYRTCNRYRVCLPNGTASTRLDCGVGSDCVASGVTNAVCRPSECGGFFDTASCAPLMESSPGQFANGVHCAETNTGSFRCVGAGTAGVGAQCNSTANCQEGLTCAFGACAEPCTSDSECDDGLGCIGADVGATDGVGFCDVKCEALTMEPQCDEETACLPVTATDGVCAIPSLKTAAIWEACGGPDTVCPDNSTCLDFGAGARCAPFCDPTLNTQAARNATCPQPTTTGYVQVAHLGVSLPDVDVYVDGALVTTLSFGDVEMGEDGFLEVPQGAREVEIRAVGGATAILTTTLNVVARQATLVAAIADTFQPGGLSLVTVDVPRDVEAGAGEATLRFVHNVVGVGDVDVVVVEDGGDLTVAGDRFLLQEGIGFGEASAFETIALGGGSAIVDVYLIPAGGDGSDVLFTVEGFEVSEETVATVHATGDVRTGGTGAVGPEAVPVAYASAPEGRALGGYCLDLNRNQGLPPEIGSGVCLETCANSDDWGGDQCTGEGDSCSPVGGGLGWCFPGLEEREAGEPCDNDDYCADGLFCDGGAFGEGVCRSYCQTTTQTNPHLGCEAGEACIPMAGYVNLGQCRIPCNPGSDFRDENCPAGMQTCLGSPGAAYCTASGSVPQGQECGGANGDPRVQDCAAGLVCAQSGRDLSGVLLDPFAAPDASYGPPTCREICTPFTSNSGCSEGFACSPITPDGESPTLGHCVEAIDTPIPSLQDCPAEDIGKMCDENSYCIVASSNQCVPPRGQCLQLCNFNTGAGCTGGTSCVEGFSGGPLFDLFGLCR